MLTYLDHAATTPMRPDAVEAMLPFFSERFANPSGSHRFARDARRAIDEARDDGRRPARRAPGRGGVHRVRHRGRQHGRDGRHRCGPVCPAVEHHAVLHPVEHARWRGRRGRRGRSRRARPARRRRSTPDVGAGVRDGRQQRGRHDHRHRCRVGARAPSCPAGPAAHRRRAGRVAGSTCAASRRSST